jgi:hypothetical protein
LEDGKLSTSEINAVFNKVDRRIEADNKTAETKPVVKTTKSIKRK